jgi:ABC-2 type transport system permease protein
MSAAAPAVARRRNPLVGLATEIGKQIVRVLSFFFKEIWAAIRQPRLILSVVLGPFLILLAFGLGYRGQTPELRTTLVVPNDPRFSDNPTAYRDLFSSVFVLQTVTRDRAAAEAALAAGATQVIVVVPEGAEERVQGGEHAQFEVLFSEVDPLQSGWVRYFATVAVQELNRRVLATLVGSGQPAVDQLGELAGQFRAQADALEADLRAGNLVGAATRVLALRQTLQTLQTTPIYSVLDPLTENGTNPLAAIEADVAGIESDLLAGRTNTPEQLQRANNLRARAQELEQQAARLTSIPPEVLVAPFAVQAQNTVPIEPTPIAFFAPAVIALLLQHIAVSLASLSMVRDRLLGAMEVYRVAPIGAREIIIGKTLSYGLMLSIVAALLVFLVNRVLGVPILGDVRWVALALGLLLFASLALGFFLSTLATTETQAVQLAMLVLLLSIFFGGFFLALSTLWPWVRTISYLLPVTYGSLDLRDIMLRGVLPNPIMLFAPLGLGVVLYLLAGWAFARQMATR